MSSQPWSCWRSWQRRNSRSFADEDGTAEPSSLALRVGRIKSTEAFLCLSGREHGDDGHHRSAWFSNRGAGATAPYADRVAHPGHRGHWFRVRHLRSPCDAAYCQAGSGRIAWRGRQYRQQAQHEDPEVDPATSPGAVRAAAWRRFRPDWRLPHRPLRPALVRPHVEHSPLRRLAA